MTAVLELLGLTVELPTTLRSPEQTPVWARPVNDVLMAGRKAGLKFVIPVSVHCLASLTGLYVDDRRKLRSVSKN